LSSSTREAAGAAIALPRGGGSGQLPAMNGRPIDIALRHVCETKELLDTLITSSQSFDYPKAKLALKALQKKSRELARAQAEFEGMLHERTPKNVIPLRAAIARSNAPSSQEASS
jgi:hypothetical protein